MLLNPCIAHQLIAINGKVDWVQSDLEIMDSINHLLETVIKGIVFLPLLLFLTTQEVERAHKYLNTCWRLDMESLDTQ